MSAKRRQQALAWMWEIVHRRLVADFHELPAVRATLPQMLRDVTEGRLLPGSAARRLLDLVKAQTHVIQGRNNDYA